MSDKQKLKRDELLYMLKQMHENIESLPTEGRFSMATQEDLSVLMLWLHTFLTTFSPESHATNILENDLMESKDIK